MLGVFVAAVVVVAGAGPGRGGAENGGHADLAVGVPHEDVGVPPEAGAVNVIYGSAEGLSAANDQVWTQGVDIAGGPEEFDRFGSSLAAGDFDGDGFADLTVGVPNEDVGMASAAGAVNVIYGSAEGLSAANDQVWTQGTPGIEGGPEESDSFGSSLAAGDFDGDGFADLAVGVSREGIGGEGGWGFAGAVNVLYGSAEGLSVTDDQVWTQATSGIEGEPGHQNYFGSSLTAGDFDGDGFADLAVGVPGDHADVGIVSAGAVNVIYGSATGLSSACCHRGLWAQGTIGIKGDPEAFDSFGSSLAAGDFDGDSFADLSVGVSEEDAGGIEDAGAVNVIYGSAEGLTSAGDQFWNQGTTGIEGGLEEHDYFGTSAAAGDFDGDGFADLAVGVAGEGEGGIGSAGAVNVIYGSAAGLSPAGDQVWTQGTTGIEGGPEESDFFGLSMVAGDFDG